MFGSNIKHPAFLEKGFRLRTRLRRTRGGNPHLRHLPEGQGGVIPEPTIGFSREKKFFLPPDTDLCREQSLVQKHIVPIPAAGSVTFPSLFRHWTF